MYIEVTNEHNEIILVIIDSIETVKREIVDADKTKALISLKSGGSVYTKQSYDDVKALLDANK